MSAERAVEKDQHSVPRPLTSSSSGQRLTVDSQVLRRKSKPFPGSVGITDPNMPDESCLCCSDVNIQHLLPRGLLWSGLFPAPQPTAPRRGPGSASLAPRHPHGAGRRTAPQTAQKAPRRHRKPPLKQQNGGATAPPPHQPPSQAVPARPPAPWIHRLNQQKAPTLLEPSTSQVKSGGDLLSHTLTSAVPSAQWALASGFGMGPGVSPTL